MSNNHFSSRPHKTVVAKYQEGANTLYNRINYQLTGDISKLLWEYDITLHDIESAAEERRQVGGIVDFDVTVGLYFPREDMSIIFERIQAHNQVSPSEPDLSSKQGDNRDAHYSACRSVGDLTS